MCDRTVYCIIEKEIVEDYDDFAGGFHMKNTNSNKKHLISLGVLCIGFVFIRYILLELHGMKQWPLVLCIAAIMVIGFSYIVNAKIVPLTTALSYIVGFDVGYLLQADGVDAGGGRTSNLWIIWTAVMFGAIVLSVIIEVFVNRKNNRKIGT